jgi:16S rRNA (guanine527-N7)-methyltransferase
MFDFRQRLDAGLALMGIEISPEAKDRLSLYFHELKKWSRKVNLIAKSTSDEQIVENHFLDSLTILPLLKGKQPHLLDIGTGAGFPALVCKAAQPELMVTLVEPRQKKVSFLGHIVRTLDLKEVRLLSCRVEDEVLLPSTMRFSHITARAVTELGALLPMVERFSPTDPQLLCMKGPRWREEAAAASLTLTASAYNLERVVEGTLPFSKAERSILIFAVNTSHPQI